MDYWLSHRPADCRQFPTFRADSITTSKMWPDDFLDHPEMYLSDSNRHNMHDVVATLRAMQGNPDMPVRVYRGAPSNGQLNTGDWVTLSLSYANQYAGKGMYSDNKNSRVYSYIVKAGELSFDGDSIFEFGYWGETITVPQSAVA